MKGESRKKTTETAKNLLLPIISWAIITSIGTGFGVVTGLAVVRTDLANSLTRIQSLESSSANKDMVAIQIGTLKESIDELKKQYSSDAKEIKELLYKHLVE